MTKNKEATRYYSDKQEKSVCAALGGTQTPNSGAATFSAGDVLVPDASLLVECKTSMTDKDSVSIKKTDWILKNKTEAFEMRLRNSCIAFNFGPGQENYYVINEKLMQTLVAALIEAEKE